MQQTFVKVVHAFNAADSDEDALLAVAQGEVRFFPLCEKRGRRKAIQVLAQESFLAGIVCANELFASPKNHEFFLLSSFLSMAECVNVDLASLQMPFGSIPSFSSSHRIFACFSFRFSRF